MAPVRWYRSSRWAEATRAGREHGTGARKSPGSRAAWWSRSWRVAQAGDQAVADGGPVVVGDAVHEGVAHLAVRRDHVVAQHALRDRAEFFDGAPALLIACIGL